MHVFSGEDAELYEIGEPFRFTALPLTDLGDGFGWRAADPALAYWLDDGLVFEVYEGDAWAEVEVLAVQPKGGCVEFVRCLRGQHVRVSGEALTASLLAVSGRWEYRQEVLVGKSLGTTTVASGGSRARLTEVAETAWEDGSVVRRVLAVLRSGATGAFVGLGEIVRDAFGVTVMFDHEGVTYVPR